MPDGRLPLHLCEVLEEEFVALPADLQLQGAESVAPEQIRRHGWWFEKEDIHAAKVSEFWRELKAVESYRRLGLHVADHIFGDRTPKGLPEMVDAVLRDLAGTFDPASEAGAVSQKIAAITQALGVPPPTS